MLCTKLSTACISFSSSPSLDNTRTKDHLNPLYVDPNELDDVDKGAPSPTNGEAAFPSEGVGNGGAGGAGGEVPDSNGSA